jgi:hypothetical protein
MDAANKIKNSNLLTGIFGEWPSFHDAEVLKIVLDRASEGEDDGPNLEADIHVFEVTSEIDDKGLYNLTKHTLVRLAFLVLDELLLTDFNHQNVLMTLGIVDISDRQLERIKFEVVFSASWGVAAKFQCSAIEVRLVQLWDPDDPAWNGRAIQGRPRAGPAPQMK